jgi:hypothetical protein
MMGLGLTRIRLQLAIYFCVHRAVCIKTLQDGKLLFDHKAPFGLRQGSRSHSGCGHLLAIGLGRLSRRLTWD